MSPAVLVEMGQRHPRGLGARQDLLGLLLHLAQQPEVLGPAVRVRLVQVQVGAVVVARPAGVALPAHRVRGALDRGRVHVPQPVPQLRHGRGRRAGGLVQLRAQRVRARRGEVLEPAAALAGVRPLAELPDERRRGTRPGVQRALQAQRQRLPVPGERGRDRAQPLRDCPPVLLRLRRGHREHLAHRVRDRAQVADRAQVLVGLVHGEFGGQPLPQQPCAAPLGVAVGAGPALGLVEPRQGRPEQIGDRLLTGGREIGQPGGTLLDAEVRPGDRIEGDELVDVGVGDLTGKRAVGW